LSQIRISCHATNITTLETHENPLLKTLLLRKEKEEEESRRLKSNWPIDLI
jgi:hypothetical protein